MRSIIRVILYFSLVCVISCEDNVEPSNIVPTCSLVATPSTGTVPLKVILNGTGFDDDGTVVKYEIDYEGDGIFDLNSTTPISKEVTYANTGVYNATLKVTDNKGAISECHQTINVNEVIYKYPGFKDMPFFTGGYWRYKWEFDEKVNTSVYPRKSGYVRITMIDSVIVKINTVGDLVLYKLQYTTSGNSYPQRWNVWSYIGSKNGVIYLGAYQNSQWVVWVLFNSQSGKFDGSSGFIGYFSSARTETLTSTSIINEFSSIYSGQAVIVSEPYFKPTCETISGVQICDDQYHDYQVKEYYTPKIGFSGFYRSGTSIYSGGGYTDMFQTTMKVWLVETNMK